MRDVVIGLDLGHSAVKMTFDRPDGVERALVPSLACPAIQIRNETEAVRARYETVQVKGRAYFVGETAALQGKSTLASGLTADWVDSDEHRALLAYARQIVDWRAAKGPRRYVLGLPVAQYETDRDHLKAVTSDYLGACPT